ncbi:unnamed protein product, partial [Ceratitis capitata]
SWAVNAEADASADVEVNIVVDADVNLTSAKLRHRRLLRSAEPNTAQLNFCCRIDSNSDSDSKPGQATEPTTKYKNTE